jgi:hypothetical protein
MENAVLETHQNHALGLKCSSMKEAIDWAKKDAALRQSAYQFEWRFIRT